MPRFKRSKRAEKTLPDDPLWYKDAVIYELHVRSFQDSDGNGIGDFRGLIQRLDYLEELGVTALWLLPFYPSPLRDDGYDIADYSKIHPSYGTLGDFKAFLREAHSRGLRVITELVINHTSDQHPWFQRARRARPESRWRDFYVWSSTPDRYQDSRIIFKDFESSNWAWDPRAQAYYWHRFYSHQPDLNFDNPAVQQAVLRIMDFWMEMGVDALRLDAVPYLYERENTICENLPETHEFLKALRKHFDSRFRNRMLLAEANQWPEDAVAYFGSGDECHMCFHFPLMPRLFMAIRTEDRFPIIDILEQTPQIPSNTQWALFLRNHDELTLEMVTDEERDYMYRVYAVDARARINLGIRRRLAPLLGNNRRKIELMNGLLMSLPGTPVIYYGDEIGMGDNIYLGDRNGVRTPMQWSADQNAGFSRTNPQKLFLPVIIDPEYHHQAINVEAQVNNPHSLLWWMRRLIALRKRFKAFGRGDLTFLQPENRKVLAFLREFEGQTILVVANLSRFAQYVELELSRYKATVPIELFSRAGHPEAAPSAPWANSFPAVGELPYLITLGPHSFYWFLLEEVAKRERIEVGPPEARPLVLSHAEDFLDLLKGSNAEELEEHLPAFLQTRRWFAGKARRVQSVALVDVVPLRAEFGEAALVLVRVSYLEGDPEMYVLPLSVASGTEAEIMLRDSPQAVVARVEPSGGSSSRVIYEAVFNSDFNRFLVELIEGRRRVRGTSGDLLGTPTRDFGRLAAGRGRDLEPSLVRGEQSNTSVVYEQQLILKLFRKLEEGENPELEIGRFLTEKKFPHISPLAGGLEYRRRSHPAISLAVLQGFVPNEGDSWRYTLDSLGRYLERAATQRQRLEALSFPEGSVAEGAGREIPEEVAELIGLYLGSAELLGQRTADLHVALASDQDNPDFAPEPFSAMAQRSFYQSLRSLTSQVSQLARRRYPELQEHEDENLQVMLELKDRVMPLFQRVLERKLTARRIRCHGDYHLGQVLYTGRDFVIIDFEGEPARPISERRLKRSAFRDVAGMLRSFHYAALFSLYSHEFGKWSASERFRHLEHAAELWNYWVSVAFLKSYLRTAGEAPFVPQSREELEILLDAHLLEKAVYELGYELNNRPEWVRIPIRGIHQLLRQAG